MSNLPKQNPHQLSHKPQKTRPVTDAVTPDGPPARKTKVMNPLWTKNPDSTETYNSSKSANPSMPWSEPEIDEISPYGPGDGSQADEA